LGISPQQTTNSSTKGRSDYTYGWQNVPDTQDILTARNTQPQIDPSIGYRLGEQQRQLNESLASPTGGYVTPQMRDTIRRSQGREFMQQAGEQTREGQFDVNRLNLQKNLALAQLTRPQLTTKAVQTGQDTQGTTRQSDPWATGLQLGGALTGSL